MAIAASIPTQYTDDNSISLLEFQREYFRFSSGAAISKVMQPEKKVKSVPIRMSVKVELTKQDYKENLAIFF